MKGCVEVRFVVGIDGGFFEEVGAGRGDGSATCLSALQCSNGTEAHLPSDTEPECCTWAHLQMRGYVLTVCSTYVISISGPSGGFSAI